MPITPSHLRPGNWIYPTGRSKYVVVTGLLLGMMEKNEDLCKEFEGIELTGELIRACGFSQSFTSDPQEPDASQVFEINCLAIYQHSEKANRFFWYNGDIEVEIKTLHHLQNLAFVVTGSELPLPEEAKIIPEGVEK